MHISIPMDKPIEFISITPVNPLISKCQIKVCYVGDEPNRNRSIITKETAKEIANTIPGCPIVGFYNDAEGDFEEHNRVIDISNGRFQIKDTTRPYGFVSMDAKVWFQWFEDDGVQHEYLCTEGYIWTGQYPEAQRIMDRGNNHSMELDEDTLNAHWTKDNNGKPQFFIINEAIMSKLCILGENVEPCFEGSQIAKVQFSFEDDFKQKLFSMIKEMQEILNEGGTTPVFNRYAVEIGDSLWSAIWSHLDATYPGEQECCGSAYRIDGIFEESGQKFAVLQNRKDMKYYRMNFSIDETNGFVANETLIEVTKTYVPSEEPQFAADAVEAYAAQFKAAAEEPTVEEEPVVEEGEPAPAGEPEVVEEPTPAEPEVTPVEEEPAQVEEVVAEDVEEEPAAEPIVVEETPEYIDLSNRFSALEQRVAVLEAENERLTNENTTLAQFKLNIEREQKKDLINNTFYMLSDDQKKDCLDNIDTYSYDDIEAKLSVICVRNKVSFAAEQDKTDSAVVTYNVDSVDESDLSVPGWIKRVQQVAKEKNI